jgi:hypothetical protein
MKKLSAAIVEVIVEDSGPDEVLRRLSNPHWFQALGCVVGFDWHSSGVTTTVCGALKEGLADAGPRAGIFLAGGKGKAARKTPMEIETIADKNGLNQADRLIYSSKMSAKVDSAAVQDGYQIYHHFFAFTRSGEWAVVQQGMNENAGQARRYHWLGSVVDSFVEEPQAAICCDSVAATLNFVAGENRSIRETCTELTRVLTPEKILQEIKRIAAGSESLDMPGYHAIPRTSYLNRALYAAYETHARDFETLLQVPGLGPSTLRALCLVAEVCFGVKASYRDPVRYAFAHGGKDGFPFPVNEADIENSYHTLERALQRVRAGQNEQLTALKRLARWHSETGVAAIVSHGLPNAPQPAHNSPVYSPRPVQGSLFE